MTVKHGLLSEGLKARLNRTEMGLFRRVERKTNRDRIRNEVFHQQLKINLIEEKISQ